MNFLLTVIGFSIGVVIALWIVDRIFYRKPTRNATFFSSSDDER